MKTLRHLSPLLIFCCLFGTSRAQYVTIPDANFATWLQTTYPACMNGNQMDTTCTAITTAITVDVANRVIRNLSGIEYFDGLLQLKAYNDGLQTIPAFPPNLTYIDVSVNQLTALPALPANVYYINTERNQLTALPALPSVLRFLYCNSNYITALPTLSPVLEILQASSTFLTTLPALPATLTRLYCNINTLTVLPALPAGLKTLECRRNNNLTVLPALNPALRTLMCGGAQLSALPSPLPNSLDTLICYRSAFTTLPALPVSLLTLQIDSSPITQLPALPATLEMLYVTNNTLTSLPALPPRLTWLTCSHNMLPGLPALPDTLHLLNCDYNQLTGLPALPPQLYQIICNNNLLTSLPQLPDSMFRLWCYNNPNLHCLPKLKTISGQLWFDNANILCLPNYGNVASSSPTFNIKPLCDPVNVNGCLLSWNIKGNAFYDVNGNCIQQNGDKLLPFLKVNLLKGGNLLEQMYTSPFGLYTFDTDTGIYTTTIDTTDIPFDIKCPASRFDTANLTIIDSLATGLNFAMQCKPGYDLVVQCVAPVRRFVPGFLSGIIINAGDVASFYGINCNTGNITGQLVVTFTGPVGYVQPMEGALTPVVNGNTLTYSIPNWGTVSNGAFSFLIATDTTAHLSQTICFNVEITGNGSDNNSENNHLTECFRVSMAFDPNDKQVSPPDVIDNSSQWLTYTIRFQNTGNAPATHIYIIDTLDAALDASTFQLLTYSHQPVVNVYNDKHWARYTFPNIDLADSTHNEPESHGYIKYRIKTRPGLNCGTKIGNAAHIYFDFNAPVATNAAISNIYMSSTTSLQNTICNGEPFSFNGANLTATGDYADTLQAAFACDSFINLHLEVLPGAEITDNAAICNGETYTWHNRTFTLRGTYTDSLQTQAGCDSVYILNLELNTGYSVTVDTTILSGTSIILPGGDTVTTAGNYIDTLPTINSCDSIITTRLSVVSGLENVATDVTMLVYPNPAKDMVMINLSDNLTGGTLTLSDVTGRALTTINLTGSHNEINTGALSSGVYLVTAVKGGVRVVQRVSINP